MNPTPENDRPTIFAWTLNKCLFTDSIFNKKKMVEYADIKKIYGFIKSNLGITYQGSKRYDHISVTDKTEQDQIQRFKEMYNAKLKGFNTAVILAKHKWGRVIPANNYLSLSIFHRPTRHSLCDGIYRDIDMINAQPTAIFEIAKQNDINMEWLEGYINDPKRYREAIMEHHNCDKNTAKTLPITLMFGGTYDGWIKENDISKNDKPEERIGDIQKIETELKTIINLVYALNPQIKKDVLKQDPNRWKTENEAKRGVMGLWGQSVERLLQEEVIKYLVENKNFEIEKIVPCQDGFMILNELWYDEIIEDCNNVIKNKYNLNIKFTEKPFDEKFNIPLYEADKTKNEWEDYLSTKRLGDTFLEQYGTLIVKYKSCVYIYHNNRWYDETDTKKRYKLTIKMSEDLYDYVRTEIEADITLKAKDRISLLKTLRNRTSSSGDMNNMALHILSKAKENEEDFNTKPFLLGFNNGVYDLEKDEFRDYNFDDYITLTTKYDYNKVDYEVDENGTIREELINIIESIQPVEDNRQLFLQILASGLDGRAYQKLFLFNGQGGNGKGLTGSLMDKILGDYYHQPSNGILKDVEKANTPSPDMINLKNKRYINFKEVAGSVKVAMLRNLTGGGKFSGRLLNQNPEQFYMSGTFVMEFNTAPELDGKPQRADYRRLVDEEFPNNFTDDPTKIGKTIGGKLYIKSNPQYETQEFLEKVKHIFLDLLLGVYRTYRDTETDTGMKFIIPESIRLRTEKFIEDQNLFQKVFNNLWVKVEIKDENDKADIKEKTTPVKEIWESITYSEEYKNLTYRDKRQYGRDEFYKWIEGLYNITGNSKTGKLVVGIVRKPDEDDIEEGEEEEGEEVETEY